MPIGTVKFWKPESGYGFIAQDGGDAAPDVFVHASEVQRVRFNVASNPKNGRDHATDLELLEPIVSQPVTPHAFRAEDPDAVAHAMALE